MSRMCLIAAALVLIVAPWAGAGNFEVLGASGLVQAPQPLHIKPGALVKAEFKSNLTTRSDVELDGDRVVPEKVAAKNDAGQVLKPAITYRDRPARAMAPPPQQSAPAAPAVVAESQDLNSDLESDLEKDLVISPPPAKSEQPVEADTSAATKAKSTSEKAPLSATKKPAAKQKSHTAVKQLAPPVQEKFAVSSKPIHKVRPVTSNSWFSAAGSYNRQAPNPTTLNSDPRMLESYTPRPVARPYPPIAVRGVPPVGAPDRIVRDGVTIKLAPAAAGPAAAQPPQEEDSAGADIFSAAAEIIGLPFAFISSFF
ncbi:MAG: hypothetical protein ACP5M0_05900 [Desulfomonilaceae bacterium]